MAGRAVRERRRRFFQRCILSHCDTVGRAHVPRWPGRQLFVCVDFLLDAIGSFFPFYYRLFPFSLNSRPQLFLLNCDSRQASNGVAQVGCHAFNLREL